MSTSSTKCHLARKVAVGQRCHNRFAKYPLPLPTSVCSRNRAILDSARRTPPPDHLQDFLARLTPRGPGPHVAAQQDLLSLRMAKPRPHARRPGSHLHHLRSDPGPRPQRRPQHRAAHPTRRPWKRENRRPRQRADAANTGGGNASPAAHRGGRQIPAKREDPAGPPGRSNPYLCGHHARQPFEGVLVQAAEVRTATVQLRRPTGDTRLQELIPNAHTKGDRPGCEDGLRSPPDLPEPRTSSRREASQTQRRL